MEKWCHQIEPPLKNLVFDSTLHHKGIRGHAIEITSGSHNLRQLKISKLDEKPVIRFFHFSYEHKIGYCKKESLSVFLFGFWKQVLRKQVIWGFLGFYFEKQITNHTRIMGIGEVSHLSPICMLPQWQFIHSWCGRLSNRYCIHLPIEWVCVSART